MTDLKSCRVCGGEGTFVRVKDFYDDSYRKYRVRCIVCGLETDEYDSKEEAVDAWEREG